MSTATKQDDDAIFSHPFLREARTYDQVPFPLLMTPPPGHGALQRSPEAVLCYLSLHRSHILSLLSRHAVLHFRNFASKSLTAEHFAAIITDSLNLTPFKNSHSNAVRTEIVPDIVFTANESPPEKVIPFHNELAQTPRQPSKIAFFCVQPAVSGGATPVLLCRAVLKDLINQYPQFITRLKDRGVLYSRVMTSKDRPHSAIGRGWKATLSADTREEAELRLRERGYTWKWEKHDNTCEVLLREISPVLPAVIDTNNGPAFFNQLLAAWKGWRDEFNDPRKCIVDGAGDLLDEDAMRALEVSAEKHAVAVGWQAGDFMLIDNFQAQHSRQSFSGKRVVLASLIS